MVTSTSTFSPTSSVQQADILLVDTDANAASYATLLRASHRVSTTASVDVARQFLRRNPPALVVVDLDVDVRAGVDICREAKLLAKAPSVLVMTSAPEAVPEALAAGCDGVLLKPFAPNLLYSRVGRLLRTKGATGGTNRFWPATHCPYCDHAGVTSFEYSSHRRAWYACLACKKVWLAKRLE